MKRRRPADAPPPEPPSVHTPSFGSMARFIADSAAYAAYWRTHRHAFEPCRSCRQCGRCHRCGLTPSGRVHGGPGRVSRGSVAALAVAAGAAAIGLARRRRES